MKRLFQEGNLLQLENTKYKSAAVSSTGALAFLILLLQEFALWSRCPRRAAKVDGWMGQNFQGTHTHPRGAAMPQIEKKVWLEKKNLRAQTCWVKGVGNANH